MWRRSMNQIWVSSEKIFPLICNASFSVTYPFTLFYQESGSLYDFPAMCSICNRKRKSLCCSSVICTFWLKFSKIVENIDTLIPAIDEYEGEKTKRKTIPNAAIRRKSLMITIHCGCWHSPNWLIPHTEYTEKQQQKNVHKYCILLLYVYCTCI